MSKVLTVIRKEYLERVRSKSFVIGTLLGPALMSMFVVLPVLLALSVIALVRNHGLVQRSSELAADVRGLVPAGEQPRDITAALSQLEPLRRHLEKLDGWRSRRPITVDMGLYRGQQLNESLRQIYYDRLRAILLRPGRDRLERGLLAHDLLPWLRTLVNPDGRKQAPA